jgi:hypothetical protein
MSLPNPNTTATLKVQSSSVFVMTEAQFAVRDYAQRNPTTKQFTDIALVILGDILKEDLSRLRKTILEFEKEEA